MMDGGVLKPLEVFSRYWHLLTAFEFLRYS